MKMYTLIIHLIGFTEHDQYAPCILFTRYSCQISRNWQVTFPAITFHHTIPPGSKQADISFPGLPFDLAILHAHQSLPCSKWRIPHTQDYLMQLTNSPQRKHFVSEDPVLNRIMSPLSFCFYFHNHAKVDAVK